MSRKIYPNGKVLINQFIDTVGNYEGFKVKRNSVFCQFVFDGKDYFAYFKCVTHEGNPYPLEHQRAQLPFREEFQEIKDSDITFLFFGYDVDNDVYVCWEPEKIKSRLNRKKYVSFYSRLSAQQSVVEGKIKDEVLTNGDKFVLFKRTDIVPFLQMITAHFPEIESSNTAVKEDPASYKQVNNGEELQGRILSVQEDEAVKVLIDSLPEDSEILYVVSQCINNFSSFYNKMHFSDWGKVVRQYLKEKQYGE